MSGRTAGDQGNPAVLAASSPDLARRAARAVSGWQDHVLHLVRAEGVTKRSVARVVSFDDESLAGVFLIGRLRYGGAGGGRSPRAAAGGHPGPGPPRPPPPRP